MTRLAFSHALQDKGKYQTKISEYQLTKAELLTEVEVMLLLSFCFSIIIFYLTNRSYAQLYNPADSTLYIVEFTPELGHNCYVYRFKEGGSEIDQSRPIESTYWIPLMHDNIPGRLYGSFIEPYRVMVTEDGGDSWEEIEVPFTGSGGAAGENRGESFHTGRVEIGENRRRVVFSSTNSWESWDTNFVAENWNEHDFAVSFGQGNGLLRRVPYGERWLEELHFSSDTGRTWIRKYLEEPFLDESWIIPGAGIDLYHPFPFGSNCIQDSGEVIFEMFDALDYGPYDRQSDFGYVWGGGRFVATNVPGELYVVLDSLFMDFPGIKYDVFHVTDYGENVEMHSYFLEDYQVSTPKADQVKIPEMLNIYAFPNPSNSGFVFNISGLKSRGSISIFDCLGRQVFTSAINQYSNQIDSQIWVETSIIKNLPAGTYIAMLESIYWRNQCKISIIK